MHTYKVYSVGRDGSHHYIDKVLRVNTAPTFIDGDVYTSGTIVADLFALFGFTQYMSYYKPRRAVARNGWTDNLYIKYNDDNVWYLERGL